jgi:hypothetical protein
MEGSISARTFDYFGLLVAASVIALCSGVVATLCVKFEERGGLRGSGSIVLRFCTSRRVLLGEAAVKSSGMTALMYTQGCSFAVHKTTEKGANLWT